MPGLKFGGEPVEPRLRPRQPRADAFQRGGGDQEVAAVGRFCGPRPVPGGVEQQAELGQAGTALPQALGRFDRGLRVARLQGRVGDGKAAAGERLAKRRGGRLVGLEPLGRQQLAPGRVRIVQLQEALAAADVGGRYFPGQPPPLAVPRGQQRPDQAQGLVRAIVADRLAGLSGDQPGGSHGRHLKGWESAMA